MLTNSAEKLLKQRYYKTGEDWNGLVKRVIEDVCNDEDAIYKNIMFNYIHDLVFLPNSPTLVNSGSKRGKFACQPYWSKVLTTNGWIPIGEIVEKQLDVDVIDLGGTSKITNKLFNGFKEVYKVTTEKNYTLYATADHKIFVFDKKVVDVSKGSFKELKDITTNDYLCIPKVSVEFNMQDFQFGNNVIDKNIAYLIGHLQTDGYISEQSDGSFVLECFADTMNLLNYFQSFMKTFNITPHPSGITRIRTNDKKTFSWLLNLANYKTNEIVVPEFIFRSSNEVIANYVSACFDSEGCVTEQGTLILTSNSKSFVCGLQLLLRTFNIISSVGCVYLSNGKRSSHYSLSITNKRDREIFLNKIGFKNEIKHSKLAAQFFEHAERKKIAYKIVSIEKIGVYPVYDISTESQTYISDGFLVHNCFVVGPTEDTLENHLETLKDIAQVAKFGGGAGYSGTFIRPKNKPVNGSTHGYSYGPNAWSANVSSYMDMMTQSGFRKMALMYTLSSEHEDLDEFIGLKQSGNELHLYNFNQSVFASDRFMNLALQDNTKQHTQLRQLAINAWSNGEPGLLFDDTINNNTPYSVSGQRIYASNPSLRAGTKVLTDLGILPIEQLENRSFKVINLNGEWSNAECFLSGKNKQLWKVTLSGGITYFCTKEHKWPVLKESTFVKTETDKLNIGDVLPVNKTIKRFGTVGKFNDGFNAGLNCATILPSLLWNDASEEYTNGFIQGFMEASVHAPSNNVLIKLYVEEYNTLFDEFKDLLGFLGYYVEYDTEGDDVILKFHFPEDPMTRTILSVEPTDFYEDVWDISVYDETHCFSLAHVVTGNCGEQLLPPYGSCNLGSINISSPYFNNHGTFDFARLEDVVVNTTRFLDDVGITNYFPNIKFKEWYDNNRPIGLGIMGFADLLLQLEIRYGSNESLTLLSKIMETLQNVSYETSTSLGKERGIPSACLELNRRNVTTTTIAPTGSISFIANCSSAIEPIFSPEYTRIDERGEKYIVLHPDADKPHFVSVVGSMNSPTWTEHVDVQLTAQKYVDAGVSKTVNLPNDATVDTVYEVFQYAYLHGAKGITVYRDNSRQFQVLNHNKPETPKTEDSCTNGCNWVKTGKCSTCSTCGSSKCEL